MTLAAASDAAAAALLKRCVRVTITQMSALFALGTSGAARSVLVHIGTSWSAESVALEAALRSPKLVEALRSRGAVLGRLCYETGQRWLMAHYPELHHGGLPALVAFGADATKLGEWEPPRELTEDTAASAALALIESYCDPPAAAPAVKA